MSDTVSVPLDRVLSQMLLRYSALRERVLDGDASDSERAECTGLASALADDLLSAYLRAK